MIDSASRGKGYGTEMISLAVKYAFTILNFKKVTLGVYAENKQAHKCYLKAGLKDTKFGQDVGQFLDEHWDLYQMAIEKE